MKKDILIIILLALVIIVLTILLLLPRQRPLAPQNPAVNQAGIEVTTPLSGQVIVSPVLIQGKIKGNGWSAFEGQAGTVALVDGNGKQLVSTILTATTDWTSPPVSFQASLPFSPGSSVAGHLIFKNENPSGDPSRDKTLVLPVKFK